MRYDKGHKRATRQRILEATGRRFKEDGMTIASVDSDRPAPTS